MGVLTSSTDTVLMSGTHMTPNMTAPRIRRKIVWE